VDQKAVVVAVGGAGDGVVAEVWMVAGAVWVVAAVVVWVVADVEDGVVDVGVEVAGEPKRW
jgi:hypothetical protein